MKTIDIYTDGSSLGNPGPGGYGIVIIFHEDDNVVELGGYASETTNNRMEMTAVIEALSHVKKTDRPIRVFSDSAYVLNGISAWVYGWQKRGWKTATGDAVLNEDLWRGMINVSSGREIEWIKVKGHAGSVGNERCDEIARTFAAGEKPELFSGNLSEYEARYEVSSKEFHRPLGTSKKSSSKKAKTAYSYVSCVDGVVKVDTTWDACKKRVNGVKGAKYQKVSSAEEEKELVGRFTLESLIG